MKKISSFFVLLAFSALMVLPATRTVNGPLVNVPGVMQGTPTPPPPPGGGH